MLIESPAEARQANTKTLESDLVVCGGGMAGCCAAITAARSGMRVTLVQDRPVLGGNASSEIRLWVLGATAHMGNNNRWAREGGVIDEIMVENTYRNPEGNPVLVDPVVLDKVVSEPNITLLLNTSVYELEKDPTDADRITELHAFCSQNSTRYTLKAPLFCDASGDGIVGFMAGAAFRMGAEGRDEFGEGFAPSEEYGQLLGHSIYFMTKDVGEPVKFVAPSYALKDPEQVMPRFREFDISHQACQFWWIEYGGRLDTVHQTEQIKWELWKIVYGVWDYVKNSGKFPEAETKTLEWVGHVPGKRESRRFEGDTMLIQQDVVQQRRHDDAVSFGGWCLDLHPADGVFTEKPGCSQWHSKGVYQIPYRTMYSRNIKNLFLAGRLISCSHAAFGSTRVMATCASNAQAVGMAAALCRRYDCLPRDIYEKGHVPELQKRLLRMGQHIPHVPREDAEDLAQKAEVTASSQCVLSELPGDGPLVDLEASRAMLLPVDAGRVPRMTFQVVAEQATTLQAELRATSRAGNFTPDLTLATETVNVQPVGAEPALAEATSARAYGHVDQADQPGGVKPNGEQGGDDAPLDTQSVQNVTLDFNVAIESPQYLFVCLMSNPDITVRCSERRQTGVLGLMHKLNTRVAKGSTQTPPAEYGVDSFEFWRPARRPKGWNLAISIKPGLDVFGPENVQSGCDRPMVTPNGWVADRDDPAPTLTLSWDEPQQIRQIVLAFDTDHDNPLETVIWQHAERAMPFCVRQYCITDDRGRVVAECEDNHQTINRITLDQAIETRKLHIAVTHPTRETTAALMGVRCYREDVHQVV
jgi:hypothetical protein